MIQWRKGSEYWLRSPEHETLAFHDYLSSFCLQRWRATSKSRAISRLSSENSSLKNPINRDGPFTNFLKTIAVGESSRLHIISNVNPCKIRAPGRYCIAETSHAIPQEASCFCAPLHGGKMTCYCALRRPRSADSFKLILQTLIRITCKNSWPVLVSVKSPWSVRLPLMQASLGLWHLL